MKATCVVVAVMAIVMSTTTVAAEEGWFGKVKETYKAMAGYDPEGWDPAYDSGFETSAYRRNMAYAGVVTTALGTVVVVNGAYELSNTPDTTMVNGAEMNTPTTMSNEMPMEASASNGGFFSTAGTRLRGAYRVLLGGEATPMQ